MKKYPALALLELSSISTGILTGDAIIKAAPVSVLKSGTVHNGKYLLLFGGSVASVEESYQMGLAIGKSDIVDFVLLPDVHQKVHDAILGTRTNVDHETLGVFETKSVAVILKAADAAVKSTVIDIVEIRLADDIGGKGLVIYNGKLEEVETALEISQEKLTDESLLVKTAIIPNIHHEMAKQLDISSIFMKNNMSKLEGGEI